MTNKQQTQHATLPSFVKTIWQFYQENGRSFSWRHVDDPYKVVVSEIMLQQTQTQRVAQKYPEFVARFSSFKDLGQASLRDVLTYWQGLGYNRRGKYLHEIAQKVMSEYDGKLPQSPELLATFPGIGQATASSICAFAFNMPTVFIETNIRTVFIHHFFKGKTNIKDADIMPLVRATVDEEKARDWYYALMDYGVMLKKSTPNPSRRSAHHTQQSKFEGSDRQIRGIVLRLLTEFSSLSLSNFLTLIDKDAQRIEKILFDLCSEKLILRSGDHFLIQ
ncbi:MAG: A/G-specific adenine glycosylase [Candidatus Dependentiae bacterium]|nr:A/G-specific adenine glycosylase [Candidatus Dependentiae bacterium]